MQQLASTKRFSGVDKYEDEEEHSLEMQYPFLRQAIAAGVKVVPIMVGFLTKEMDEEFASCLQQYFDSDDNLFIFSTDFCHWGKRFGYTYYKKEHGAIHESIRKLDHEGMAKIEQQDAE